MSFLAKQVLLRRSLLYLKDPKVRSVIRVSVSSVIKGKNQLLIFRTYFRIIVKLSNDSTVAIFQNGSCM